MRRTRKGYAKDWKNYYGQPATTYYSESDILSTLSFYSGKAVTELPDPNARWNDYYTVEDLVSETVEPYRIVRD